MATLMDELDDDEIEASLLWTDDEDGDNDIIDPLDEEMLLSEPVKIGKPMELLKTQFSAVINANNDSNVPEKMIDKLELEENGSINNSNAELELESEETPLDTTLSSEVDEVALDVTFNTRDGLDLDTSVCDKEAMSVSADVTIVESVDENDVSECNKANHNASTGSSLELTIVETADSSINANDISSTSNSSPIISNLSSETSATITTELNSADSYSELPSSDSPIVQNNSSDNTVDNGNMEINTNTSNKKDQTTNKEDITTKKEDQTTLGLPITPGTSKNSNYVSKNIKRVKSLSDEQRPVNKRLRSSSEPTNLLVSEDTKTNDAPILSKDNIVSPKTKTVPKAECCADTSPTDTKSMKKKSVVSFNIKNYSKTASCDPYVCSTCNVKFKGDAKFESHLISSHAVVLTINDFDIDIHQHYKQKREKLIAQGKTMLPKLAIQEGLVDQALISDYTKNIKYVGSPKNPQYFCKVCENLYSTKNLIIEHLKSSKHQLKKSP